MSKKNWDDIVKEPMSESLRHRTEARIRKELEGNEKERKFSWNWLMPIAPALALALYILRKPWVEDKNFQLAEDDEEILNSLSELNAQEIESWDQDLIADLDFYTDLDVLEEWDGTDES